MSDSIKPISAIPSSETAAQIKALPTQAEAAAQARSANNHIENRNAPQATSTNTIKSLANVSIHFRVDDKTNDITVFLVDRKSRKVLRSIPPNELQKLQIGDLLKLTM